MEVGRLPENELAKVDFSLPPEPGFNKGVLTGKPAEDVKVYLGCAKWGHTVWAGKIYPPNTKEKDFLQHYVNHYNSVELNATHYKLYGPAGIRKWAEKAAGKDFLFCPKMYQGVTHRGSLKGKDFVLSEFLRGIVAFEKHLGPVFVQLSDGFSPKRRDELMSFLDSLPKDMQFFLEVRHSDWFLNGKIRDDLFSALRSMGVGIVITDTAGRRECAHMHLTLAKAFIRYVGNSLHPTDYTRVDDWAARMKYWISQGAEELFFFMHMHDEATSPELTVYLADKLNKECGLKLVKPVFVETNAPAAPSRFKRKGLFD